MNEIYNKIITYIEENNMKGIPYEETLKAIQNLIDEIKKEYENLK